LATVSERFTGTKKAPIKVLEKIGIL